MMTVRLALASAALSLLLPGVALADQACPAGKSCYYVTPIIPPPAISPDAYGGDLLVASPQTAATATYSINGAVDQPLSVAAGSSTRIAFTSTMVATAFHQALSQGLFLQSTNATLIPDERVTATFWQSSATVKPSTVALGTRFRAGGYSLNLANGTDATGYDYVIVYAPTAANITATAPTGATLPYWGDSIATATTTFSLAAGQTFILRTRTGVDIDGALITSDVPVSVAAGGRGWGASCGDDGEDLLVPADKFGSTFVVAAWPATTNNRVRVVADTDNTLVHYTTNGTTINSATINGGQFVEFVPAANTITLVTSSNPTIVFQNAGLSSCELDLAVVPPTVFANIASQTLAVNVLTGETGVLKAVIATASVGTIKLDNVALSSPTTATVPSHPEWTVVTMSLTGGTHTVSASSDFQLGLVAGNGGTGLFGYPSPYRVAGCSDGVIGTGETCDDGNVADGDGCSSVCQIETGFTCSGAPSVCGCNIDATCSNHAAGTYCATGSSGAANSCAATGGNGTPIPTDHGTCGGASGSVGAPEAACSSGACNAVTNTCAAAGGGACTANNQCTTNYCLPVSHTCAPAGGCTVDGDCATDQYCNASQVCQSKGANGVACAANTQCTSGVCDTDNLCGYGNGRGTCDATSAGAICRSGNCGASSHKCVEPGDGCTVDADCTSAYCAANMSAGVPFQCVTKLADGQAIPNDTLHGGTCNGANALAVCQSGVCNAANKCGPGVPSTISVVAGTPQSATVQAAFTTALRVIVRDGSGIAVPNVTVTFTAPSTGPTATLTGTPATTDGTGQASVTATAGTVAGAYNVTATVSGVGTPASFALTNLAGVPAAIAISSGATQSAAVGASFAPIVARVTDALNNPTAGATVTFSAPASGASAMLGSATATTNASGLAQTTATANTVAGSYAASATITVTGGGTVSASATLTNSPGAGALLTITGGNGQVALLGAAFASALTVRVTDASGNVVPGTTVTFTAVPSPMTGASATLSSASAITTSTGIASVSATANAIAGSYTVVASHSSAPSASISLSNQFLLGLSPTGAAVAPRASATFVATGGTGTGYAYSIQSAPSGGTINATTGVYTAGATPAVTDVVKVTDSGNHTATVNVAVGASLALSSNPTQVAPRGSATFTTTGGTGTGLTFIIATNRSHGTIDASGHYVAGATAGVTDAVTVIDSVGNTAMSSIDVGAGVALTGNATQIPPRGAVTFTAAGGAGSFAYALQANPSGGTINATTGAYTAGALPDVTDVVSVTDPLGNTATANVAVGHGVTVNPPSPSVAPLGTITLSAAGGSGTDYTFALAGGASGTIGSATGVYVAGGAANVTDMVTVTDSLGNVGTTSVSVGGGLLVTPSSLTSPPHGSKAFTVTGGSGAGYAFSLTANESGGTVDGATGAYVAGGTGSASDVLRVVDSLGNQATVTITVGPIVAVSPTTAMLAPLGRQTIAISGGSGVGYAFALSANPSGGHIDAQTGEYVAGTVGGVTDVISAHDNLGNTATARMTVTAGMAAGSATLSVAPRATAQVTVTGGAPGYVFSLTSNGSGGTIDPATGAYVAGGNPDSTDFITITDQNGAVIDIVVTIGPGVTIAPAQPSAAPRGTVALGATGGSGTGYLFTISDNQSGGSIVPATGVYTAGSTGSVADIVTVTDSLGNRSAVSVAVGGRLVLSPVIASVSPREHLALSAFDGSGTGFTYTFQSNASGGTVDGSTGAYVAGDTPSVADVVMVTDSLGNLAYDTITVGPGLTAAPSVAATPPRGTISLVTAGGSGAGYQFALSTNGSGGTVSNSGVYTAGAVGDTSDVVTITDSLGNTATVTITVDHGLTLTAGAATVPPRGSTAFTAAGGVGDGFQFTLQTNGSGGAIVASTGAYTAGFRGGATDIVLVTDPFGNTTTRSITVGPGVSISPTSPATSPRGAVTLVASGGSGAGYAFTFIQNASGGTIGAGTGLYTAGSTTDVHDTVQVADSLGNSASVSISVGGALTVSAAIPTLSPRESVLITVVGGSGTGYTFTLTTNGSGGTIDPATGQYMAGNTGNTQDVVTVTDSVGNTARVTITVGDTLHITPTASNVAPLAQITFMVSGGSGHGDVYALGANHSHGTIDAATGAYTAGATGGATDTVTVTDSLGNSASATVTVGAALAATSTITVAPRGMATVVATGGAAPLAYTLTSNGSGGSINPTTGVYTAGANGDTTDVISVSDANGATITVTVQIGPGLAIAPATGTVVTGQTVALTATGGSGTDLHWTLVSSGTGGSIDPATGVYTAGPHAGMDVVRVTDSLGNTAQRTITVAVDNAPRAVDLRGGGCTCALGDSNARSGAGAPIALGLIVSGLVLVSRRRRRRRAPSSASAGSRWARRLWTILIFGGVVALPAPSARAQSAGFALDQFNPAQSGSDWFVLDSLDIHGNMRPAVGVSTSWAYRPLVLTSLDGTYRMSVMKNQAVSHVGASLVVLDRLRFGLDLPVQFFGQGAGTNVAGVDYMGPASSSSLGDMRLNATVRAFGNRGGGATLAFMLTAYLPTGDGKSYAGDSGAGVAPSALVAGERGMFAYAAQLGGTVRGRTEFAGLALGSDLFFSASAGVRLARDKVLVGPEVYGRSMLVGGEFLTSRATPVEGMLGAHYSILREWRASAGFGTGLNGGIGSPTLRGLIAVEWSPGYHLPDRDFDLVADATDACPDVVGIGGDDARTNGCPPAPPAPPPPPAQSDRDHDGVADAFDACPEIAGVASHNVNDNGCPPPPPDRDHDGVADATDACPDIAGVADADPKHNGCPVPTDRDGDSIVDADDACPDVPGVATDNKVTNGCPDPDRDHDGIANSDDACPDASGPHSDDPQRNGCPQAFVAAGQIKILDQVKFRKGRADILDHGQANQASEHSLMAVRQILIDHAEVKSVRVEGYSDSAGNAARNLKLSAARAAAVVKWLIAHGIAGDRLTSVGFGPERPADTNDTEAGRRNNRRVEFHIAEPSTGQASMQ